MDRKNEKDEFLVFCENESRRWRGLMKKMVVLTGETHEVGCSTRQELCDLEVRRI